jgi:3-dehydroquinate synthase
VNLQSDLLYLSRLPSPHLIAENPILIFDRRLLKNNQIKKWLQKFPNRYGVDAGESLKQIISFNVHVNALLKIVERVKIKKITLVAIGGGSVGDFVGFLASVFKRGVPLVHIPSTWLAAIDSSHGGKTALNAGGCKNQIGTFYPAEKVIICKQLLFTQPEERVSDAMGEILKTGLLCGGQLWKTMSLEKHFDKKKLWLYLPHLISYKYKIVEKDPYEKKGLRYILNFGHTFGHVLETTQNLPHGVAVNIGLRLALEFSADQNIISRNDLRKIYQTPLMQNHLANPKDVETQLNKIKNISTYLFQDKKLSKKGLLHFVFLSKPGKPFVIEVPVSSMINFIK